MQRNPHLAGLLSLVAPGSGQIFCGKLDRGVVVLVAAIVIGNLNIIFLPAFVGGNPDPEIVWACWIPRIGHDVLSAWSIVFWLWAVADAYLQARKA